MTGWVIRNCLKLFHGQLFLLENRYFCLLGENQPGTDELKDVQQPGHQPVGFAGRGEHGQAEPPEDDEEGPHEWWEPSEEQWIAEGAYFDEFAQQRGGKAGRNQEVASDLQVSRRLGVLQFNYVLAAAHVNQRDR